MYYADSVSVYREARKKRIEFSKDLAERAPEGQVKDFFNRITEGEAREIFNYAEDDTTLSITAFYEEGNTPFETSVNILPNYFLRLLDSEQNMKMVTSNTPASDATFAFAVNCINFLNATNVEKIPYERETEDEKRESHFKQLPADYYLCKVNITKEVVEAAKRLTGHKANYRFEFDVRGHFRKLISDKFKIKKGQRVWIKPYKKGSGVYIPKTYVYEK
ncbi:hypothetical protein H0N96_03375 [Candidatus Micrarchaeota archaeon]|nr:hypothetical protein [Candidatus Micrarchaeota archaeon]